MAISEKGTLFNAAELSDPKSAREMLEKSKSFIVMMTQYKCAMLEIKTKLDVLNAELSLESEHNPFEAINCRLKSPLSISEKLARRELEVSVENIYRHIHDVAGIRVICSYTDDIYMISEKLCNQDDVRLLDRKDYIKNPKPNGYRSLHLILEIPIFLAEGKKYMPVEVQFRTIAMDFWASLEHKIRYKKKLAEGAEPIVAELKKCADEICAIDGHMQSIRDRIEQLSKVKRREE